MTPTQWAHKNAALSNLGPLQQLRAGRMPRRLLQLAVGLAIYGASMAMVVRGALGAIPWDVLHTGLIEHIPITFGQMSILLALVVLLMWIPLRQMPGLGTIANVFLVGLAADIALAIVPETDDIGARLALLLGGIVLNAMATAMYIGSQLGPGPRDGLMTGLARISGRSIRLVRTIIEISVVALGSVLGGSLGFGTVLYALAIGPLAHWMLPWFIVGLPAPNPTEDESSSRF
jgi:uncharacterized membrane protein YczE